MAAVDLTSSSAVHWDNMVCKSFQLLLRDLPNPRQINANKSKPDRSTLTVSIESAFLGPEGAWGEGKGGP